jgi:hypothetical protein
VPLTSKIEILKVSLPLRSCPVWDSKTGCVTSEFGYDHKLSNAESTGNNGDDYHNIASSSNVTDVDLARDTVEQYVLRVVCADGLSLGILHLQPAGKRVMDARSFANGLQGRSLQWV